MNKPCHFVVTRIVGMTMMPVIMITMMMAMISVMGKACQWSSRSTPDKARLRKPGPGSQRDKRYHKVN